MGNYGHNTTPLAEMPLFNLYLQIDAGSNPLDTLGLEDGASLADVKHKYRVLARVLHPDKTKDIALRATHTRLFQVVQHAFEILVQQGTDGRDDHGVTFRTQKRLLQTADALHARNIRFKEDLKAARATALTHRQRAQAVAVARKAKLREAGVRKAEHDAERKLGRNSGLRKRTVIVDTCLATNIDEADKTSLQEGPQADQATEDEQHNKPRNSRDAINKRRQRTKLRRGEIVPCSSFSLDNASPQDDMPSGHSASREDEHSEEMAGCVEQQRLDDETTAACEERRAGLHQVRKASYSDQAFKKRKQESAERFHKPPEALTSTNPGPFDQTANRSAATAEEIKDRTYVQLVKGGTSGSVSLEQKKAGDQTGAAKSLRLEKVLWDAADDVLGAAAKKKRYCFTEEQAILQTICEMEDSGIEKRVDDGLKRLGPDVLQQYYLEDPTTLVTTSLGHLMLGEAGNDEWAIQEA